jgi:ribose transport system substrate-binding protein
MYLKKKAALVAAVGLSALLALTACSPAGGAEGSEASNGKEKIFLNLSYSGNNWQDQAANLAMAVAESPEYVDKYDVTKIISGSDVQKQISDLQSMIAQGAKLIVFYPISPTALNPVIKQGCDAGVTMFAYDGTVTEPCAWNLSQLTGPIAGEPDRAFFGKQTAQGLVDLLGGEGKIMLNRGVSGTSTDEINTSTAKAVFDQYPGIEIVNEYYGNWDSSVSQQETAKALTAHPDIDGVWSQLGEDGVIKALEAVGLEVPVAGEGTNYFRTKLYEGWRGVSSGSPSAQGGIAMKLGIRILEQGADSVPKNMETPLPFYTTDTVKPCPGSAYEDGCSFFPDAPDSFETGIFEATLFPEGNFDSATKGTALTEITPLPEDLSVFAQPGERRILTRGVCDDGWTETTDSGIAACKQ